MSKPSNKTSVKTRTAKSPSKSNALYQLKISLVGAEPAIWRRVNVQSKLTLAQVHEVLQVVMGWEDCHLHVFIAQGQMFSDPDLCEDPEEFQDESKVTLAEALPRAKSQMFYEYNFDLDFGGGWEHLIVLEKILPATLSQPLAEVLVGEGACPLEDIGGLDGWYYFLDVIAHPESEEYQDDEHQEMREWVEADFNPNFYDVKAVNVVLQDGF